MLVASYYSNSDVRIEERPIPEIGEGECLVKIHASGICGSDLMEWYRRDKVPLVLGHEVAGEIVGVAPDVDGLSSGDRVAVTHHVPCFQCRNCRRGNETVCQTLRSTNFDPGGFSQYVRLPEINTRLGICSIPDHVSYEEASFAEPLGCVIRGQRRAGVREGDVVVVVGTGMSGVLHVALAKASGARAVVGVDIVPRKLTWAEQFGADRTTDAMNELPNLLQSEFGHKADMVILTTGNSDAVLNSFQAIEDGGTVLLFAPGEPDTTVPIDITDVFFKRDVTVTSTYAAAPGDLTEAMTLIADGTIPVAEMITHKIGLEQIQDGFDLIRRGTDSLKIIVEPNR